MKKLFIVFSLLISALAQGQSEDFNLSNMNSFAINAQNPWNSTTFDNPLGMNFKVFNEEGSSAIRYRAIFNYGFLSLESYPNSNVNTLDRFTEISISIGKETRLNNSGRVQGYAGYDFGAFSFGEGSKTSAQNDWSGESEFGIFGQGFIGAEVFLISRLSLSAEIGYGMSYGALRGGSDAVAGYAFDIGNDIISPAAGMLMITYYFPN